MNKTKEMVVTFFNKQRETGCRSQHNYQQEDIEIVEEYRVNFKRLSTIVPRYLYLGTIFNNNTGRSSRVVSKEPKGRHDISLSCWFHSISLQNRNNLQSTESVPKLLDSLSEPSPLTHSVPCIWLAPLRTPVFLPRLQDTKEGGDFFPMAVQLLKSQ